MSDDLLPAAVDDVPSSASPPSVQPEPSVPPAKPQELTVPKKGQQQLVPIIPGGSVEVTMLLAVQRRGEEVVWFMGMMPVFTHQASDTASFRMFAAQLCVQGVCSQAQIIRAFDVAKVSMIRWVEQYRTEGPASFFRGRKPGVRGDGPVLTVEVVAKAEVLLNSGRRLSEVATELGIKYDTLQKALRHGKVRRPEKRGSRRRPQLR